MKKIHTNKKINYLKKRVFKVPGWENPYKILKFDLIGIDSDCDIRNYNLEIITNHYDFNGSNRSIELKLLIREFSDTYLNMEIYIFRIKYIIRKNAFKLK